MRNLIAGRISRTEGPLTANSGHFKVTSSLEVHSDAPHLCAAFLLAERQPTMRRAFVWWSRDHGRHNARAKGWFDKVKEFFEP
jgi:hypothetical protein